MNNPKLYTLSEIIKSLVGDTDAWGETNHDEKVLNNLDLLQEIGDYVLMALYNNAKYKNDYRSSIACIGHKSIRIAKDFEEAIKDILSYDKEGEDNEK